MWKIPATVSVHYFGEIGSPYSFSQGIGYTSGHMHCMEMHENVWHLAVFCNSNHFKWKTGTLVLILGFCLTTPILINGCAWLSVSLAPEFFSRRVRDTGTVVTNEQSSCCGSPRREISHLGLVRVAGLPRLPSDETLCLAEFLLSFVAAVACIFGDGESWCCRVFMRPWPRTCGERRKA